MGLVLTVQRGGQSSGHHSCLHAGGGRRNTERAKDPGSYQTTLLRTVYQQELVIRPPLVAWEAGKRSLYSGWLCTQLKPVGSEKREEMSLPQHSVC